MSENGKEKDTEHIGDHPANTDRMRQAGTFVGGSRYLDVGEGGEGRRGGERCGIGDILVC